MKLRSRVEHLEKAARFTRWFQFSRFLEGLTDKELEEIAIHWRFPEPLPDPLPTGRSELDGLDRARLLRLWEESERETSRIMHEIRDRYEDERRFYLHHGHRPEQAA